MLKDIYDKEQQFYYFYDMSKNLIRVEITKDTKNNFIIGRCYPEISEEEDYGFDFSGEWLNQPNMYKELPIKIIPQKYMVGAAFMNPFNKTIYCIPYPTMSLLAHEYKHYKQLEEMGLFKFVMYVGIPSVLSCIFDGDNHSNYAYEQETTGFKKFPILEKLYVKYKEKLNERDYSKN